MSLRSRRFSAAFASAVTALALAGCAVDDGYLGSGSWQPKPEGQAPQIPAPDEPAAPGQPGQPSDPSQPADDGVRATGLDQPSAITALPDGTALVVERTSGQVTKVFPTKGAAQQPQYVVPGVDPSGGGVLALAASPYYAENDLIYAYITTAADGQVVSLNASGVPKPIVTGLPKAPAAMAIGPDGSLLVAIGGSGHEYSGKVISVDPWGGPGPSATAGLVVKAGVQNPVGLCTDGINLYAVDGGTGQPGALQGNAVFKITGESSPDAGMTSAMDPLIEYTAGKDAGATGCIATPLAIITAGTDSQSLATSVLDQSATVTGDPALSLTGQYGRLRAIALDPINGGVWVGTYNRDGIGAPAADDDRVLYIPPPAGGGGGDIS